jgi:hypothetical protein
LWEVAAKLPETADEFKAVNGIELFDMFGMGWFFKHSTYFLGVSAVKFDRYGAGVRFSPSYS